MSLINKPKGTFDILPSETRKWQRLEEIIMSICDMFNYKEIRTPIFEKSELFHRSVGETSDIVSKETYDFVDRANRKMTLRPEGTASVIRSVIENKLYANQTLPLKLFYHGPLFRYERPQKGRQRQFNQFGIECIGINHYTVDVEIMQMAYMVFNMLGIKGVKININSIGDRESRDNYRTKLQDYFSSYLDELCEDCKQRFNTNPLRILDCKIDNKKDFFNNAPKIVDSLNSISKEYFDNTLKLLDKLDIEYVINHNLVRGLDYYSHIVFEVVGEIEGFGSNNVLGGGGRYNELVSDLGGPDLPSCGFAFGIERLLLALELEQINIVDEDNIDVFVIVLGDNKVFDYAFNITSMLRINGFKTETVYDEKGIKSQFKQSDRLKAKSTIVIGENEMKNNKLNIKFNNKEEKIDTNVLIEYLDKILGE